MKIPQPLTVKEASKRYGLSDKTVYYYLKNGTFERDATSSRSELKLNTITCDAAFKEKHPKWSLGSPIKRRSRKNKERLISMPLKANLGDDSKSLERITFNPDAINFTVAQVAILLRAVAGL